VSSEWELPLSAPLSEPANGASPATKFSRARPAPATRGLDEQGRRGGPARNSGRECVLHGLRPANSARFGGVGGAHVLVSAGHLVFERVC